MSLESNQNWRLCSQPIHNHSQEARLRSLADFVIKMCYDMIENKTIFFNIALIYVYIYNTEKNK